MAGGSMGRLIGIGFLVGAKDDGATDTLEEVAENTDRLADAAERAGDKGEKVGLLRRALEGFASINLANISERLDDIAERAGLGIGAQSTSLESFGAQFAQTYRAATAGMGATGEIVGEVRRQISGVAHSLQIGAEQLLQPITQLASHGRRLEDFGISVRELGGAIQAGFIDAGNFGQALTELTNSFGLSEAQAGGLLDRITAIGEQFGVGQDAVRGFPQALEAMRPILSRFPEMGNDVEGLTESVIRLGMGIQTAAGTDTRTAISQAAEVFAQLGEQRMGLQDLVTGLQTEMPNALQEMAIGLGSWDEAMQVATESPARFATMIAGSMSTMDQADPLYQRLRSTLNQFGPGFQVLLNGSESSRAALEAMNQPLEDVEGSFGRVARAASGSTRTFSENLELMRDAFQTRMNAIGRRTMPDFVSRQRDAYRNVGNTVEEFAGESGPLGVLTRGFLRVRTFGLVQGLLPQLGALGEGLGDTAAAAGPVITAMGDLGLTKSFSRLFQQGGKLAGVTHILGGAFRWVLGPIGLVGGAAYLLYRYWDKLPGLFEDVAVWLGNLATRFTDWVDSIDWRDLGDRAVSNVLAFFDTIGGGVEANAPRLATKIGDAFKAIFSAAGRMIAGLASGMWSRIVEWITDPPNISAQVSRAAQTIGATIGGVLGVGMFTPLRNNIISAFGRLFGSFGNIMTGGQGVLRGGARTLLRRIPYVGAIIGVLFDLPDIIESFNTGGVVAGLRQVFESIVDGLLMGLPSLIGRLTGTEDIFNRIFDFLFEGLNVANIAEAIEGGEIGRAILEGFMAIGGGGFGRMIWDAILGEGAGDTIMSGMGGVLEGIGSIFTEIGSAYMTVVDPIWEALQEAGGQVMDIFSELWSDTIQPLFADIWGAISPVTEVFDSMGSGVGDIAGAFDNAEAGVRGFGEMAGDFIRNNVAPAIVWLAENAIPLVVDAVRSLADNIRSVVSFWREAWPTIETVFGYIADGFRAIGSAVTWWWENVTFPVLRAFQRIWDGINEHVVPLATDIFSAVGGIVSWWWESITLPVFNALRTVFTAVVNALLPVARTVFGAIGSVISWWWNSVTMPVFNALRTVFVTVVTAIGDAASTVFDWMARFITNRIEEASLSFAILRVTWEETKTALAAGFRLIAAEVNRWLLVPFIRLRGSLVGMADMVRMAWLQVKESVLQVFVSIIEGLQATVRRIPGRVGEMLASALDEPLRSVRERVTSVGEERTGLASEIQRQQRLDQEQIDEANRRAQEARESYDESLTNLRSAAGRAATEHRQRVEQERQARERQDSAAEEADQRRRREARERDVAAEEQRRRTREEGEQARIEAQAARERESAAAREARAATEARRTAEAEGEGRRGRGARRAARREGGGMSAGDMADAVMRGMATAPGSSRDRPSHVVIDDVNPMAAGSVPRVPAAAPQPEEW